MPMKQSTDEERWQRFTLLDVLLLFPAYAIGAAAARQWKICSSQTPQNPPPWPAQVGNVELALVGVVLGSVLAGWVILSGHWIVRHRRTHLSVGEWLWLSPVVLEVAGVTGSSLTRGTPVWFMFFAGGLAVCAILGILVICCWTAGVRGRVPCPWTDVFGSVACVLAAAMVAYSVIVDPIRI